jgi:hypothetical protein
MKLYTIQQAFIRRGDQLYKESSVIPLLVAMISFGVAAWILYLYGKGDAPLFIAIVSGGGMILFGLFCFHLFRKSLSKNNWCVAFKPEGALLIKFRSHLNDLLPDTDKQVVFLKLSEIDSAGIVKITQISDARRGTRIQHFTFLAIHTKGIDLEPLSDRLKYEIQAEANIKYQAYPVSVHDKTIRIQWRSAQIKLTPRIGSIMEKLTRQGVTILPTRREKVDLRARIVKNRENPEDDIIRMVEQGDRIGAVRLARKLYNFDLAQAKKFVDQLDQ